MAIDPKDVEKAAAPFADGREWIIAPCKKCGHDFGFFENTIADQERICTGCSFFGNDPVFGGAIHGM